jgi:hypothetical protein
MGEVKAAWYQREFSIPKAWSGRRIVLSADCLNSYEVVFVDGSRAGEIRFPGGELEIGNLCKPEQILTLSLFVAALPLKGVLLSYTDSASAREVKGSVERRGLCGDVFLVSTPAAARLETVRVQPSVRHRECVFDVQVAGLAADPPYRVRATIMQGGRRIKEFTSHSFTSRDLDEGHVRLTESWLPDRLWDIHTPEHTFTVEAALLDASGKVVDSAWPERFGFREFWIEGRDFILNGSRIFLSAVPLDNAQVSVASASYNAARETLERLKSFGINYIYTHNYGCDPGSHLAFEEILRAADDVGMLVGLSQPHFSHYQWQTPEANKTNGYARHAEYYVRVAYNHPSVVMYVMSHNATGYDEDMNPDMIDGIQDARDTWARKNSALALRAETIVQGLDPGRIVYHHASGNLGVMHDSNFYPNFAPIQELSDWFEHWATNGVKPAFTCEYGAPFTWDWTMYRGWYRGQREFGSAAVPWEFCLAEWNSQFLGDRAFNVSEPEKANLRWEAKQFRAGKLWHRWDYPFEVGSSRFTERYPVLAAYITDNWRGFRTWGLSANSPWEYSHFWKLREGVDRNRRDLQVDWENLQRPGFSPDYIDQQYQSMDLAYDRSDWIPTPAAQALLRNNSPLLAYIAGKPARFSSKDHNFLPGEILEKQIVLINNSRQPVSCDCEWSLNLPRPAGGHKMVGLETGQIQSVPLQFDLPATLPAGSYRLTALVKFSNGEDQSDDFTIDVLAPPHPSIKGLRIAAFDPKGETISNLNRLGFPTQPVEPDADLSSYDFLIIGKGALTVYGPAPDLKHVRDGFKVLVFEQTREVLEKRLGLRAEEYGLRQVFPRVPDHLALAGLEPQNLRDWRGTSTIIPPRLKYESRPRYGPTVQWCDIPVTRVWRCGNQGNVASVLIEKPACGDFLPVVDGGFSLQFSPLMEYREGKGMVLFCQLDVTGRTATDPAADLLLRNLIRYVSQWKPSNHRNAFYAGESAGRKYLESIGASVRPYEGQRLSAEDVLIAGPGIAETATNNTDSLQGWLKNGGHLLALSLNQQEAAKLLPFEVRMKTAEHISSLFEPLGLNSPLAGIGPADVHNRDPREFPLLTGGTHIVGDGILGWSADSSVVFCQLVPWQFDKPDQLNLRRTHRRTAFLLARLLANLGVAEPTPLLQRFAEPVKSTSSEKRFLSGLYMDQPQEWDDPYRFFRW